MSFAKEGCQDLGTKRAAVELVPGNFREAFREALAKVVEGLAKGLPRISCGRRGVVIEVHPGAFREARSGNMTKHMNIHQTSISESLNPKAQNPIPPPPPTNTKSTTLVTPNP